MDAQSSGLASPSDDGQLQQTKQFWQERLSGISKRLSNKAADDSDEMLTFTLARRNFIQGNLERAEHQLLLARVSHSAASGRVGVGSVVHIQRGNDIRAIMIIPAADADPNVEYVSAKSALGRALLNKRVGDTVEIKTSLGKQNYGILRLE